MPSHAEFYLGDLMAIIVDTGALRGTKKRPRRPLRSAILGTRGRISIKTPKSSRDALCYQDHYPSVEGRPCVWLLDIYKERQEIPIQQHLIYVPPLALT